MVGSVARISSLKSNINIVFPPILTWTGVYRFSFNGMEKVDEIIGSSNPLDYGARIYDGRLGRWLSVDPMNNMYPDQSPYNYCINNPLLFVDPNGAYIIVSTKKFRMINGEKVELKGFKSLFIKADIIEKTVTFHQVKLMGLADNYFNEDNFMYNIPKKAYDKPGNYPTFKELNAISSNLGFIKSSKDLNLTLKPSKLKNK